MKNEFVFCSVGILFFKIGGLKLLIGNIGKVIIKVFLLFVNDFSYIIVFVVVFEL